MNLFENILNKAKANFANQDPTQNLQYKAINKLAGGISAVTGQGMEDPTQSLLYKGLQSGANLYTGTAEEATMGGQREFERKKEVARQFLSKKGYTPDVIENTLSQIEYKPSFMGRVTEGLGNRMQEVARTTDTLSNVQNPLQRLGVGTLAYGGDVVASAMEPVASAISPIVQSGIEKAGLTDTVQNLGQKYQGFKESNPLTADVIEGVANIGQLAPIPVGKVAGKVLKPAVNATGKAIVKTAETVAPTVKAIPKAIKKAPGAIDDAIESGVEKLAKKALGSSDGTAELFKATSPSYNVLAKSKDISKIKQKARLADEAVVDAGFAPKTTTERVSAYSQAMKKYWNDVETARGSSKVKFDAGEIAKVIDDEIQRLSVNGVVNPAIQGDINALMKQSEYFRGLGNIDMPTLGNQRTLINTITDWGAKTEYGDTFSAVMKKAVAKIREAEDNVLGSIGDGKASDALGRYGALRSMYDDIVKQDIKALRAKGLPIEESFGRIAGTAELLGGIGQLVMNPKQAITTIVSGGSKVLLGKVAGKMKDPDYLIRTGYEKLLKSKKSNNGNTPGNTPMVRTNSNSPTSKQKIVRQSSVKPSPQVKPVEKTVKPTEKKVETNITRNEAIEKGFSDSSKARWDKGDFTMKERGEAIKYLKSNYKGKEYTIDGKKYKVDAIDNRNEQVRLLDSEGNIIRVKTNKLPETKVTDKDIFDYYNGRVQKGYKTVLSSQKTVKPKK